MSGRILIWVAALAVSSAPSLVVLTALPSEATSVKKTTIKVVLTSPKGVRAQVRLKRGSRVHEVVKEADAPRKAVHKVKVPPGTYRVRAKRTVVEGTTYVAVVDKRAVRARSGTTARVTATWAPVGKTTRVSVASDGTQARRDSYAPAISADGRYIAFKSTARSLVPGDTNRKSDVFVRDRVTGTTTRVSVASDGTEATGRSDEPTISGDGRYIAFESRARNLLPGRTAKRGHVYVHNRVTGATRLVSVAPGGAQADSPSSSPAISGDGRYIVFESQASNLVPGGTNGVIHVFVHDRVARTTALATVASDGTQANSYSYNPAISGNGRYVAFDSEAGNLVPDDTQRPWWAEIRSIPDVFMHDRLTGSTIRISVASDGTEAGKASFNAAISGDGRYVAYESFASNLVPADTNKRFDVFLWQRPGR